MTTTAAQVVLVRRILQDDPEEDYLTEAVAASSTTTLTVNDVSKYSPGQVWEFDDDTGDTFLVRSVDRSTSIITVKRSHKGSTGATHADNVVVLNAPRFRYDLISQALSTAVDADLWTERVFEIAEHIVVSSATADYYNAPSANCEEFLAIYQDTASMIDPEWIRDFGRLPRNVDTSLYAAGKAFRIRDNYGAAGDNYYINCAHRLTLATLSTQQERIVQWLACAYLLEWTEPKRLAGPTNQGDRTVRPGAAPPTAAYYRSLAERLIASERSNLKNVNLPFRVFKKEGGN